MLVNGQVTNDFIEQGDHLEIVGEITPSAALKNTPYAISLELSNKHNGHTIAALPAVQ